MIENIVELVEIIRHGYQVDKTYLTIEFTNLRRNSVRIWFKPWYLRQVTICSFLGGNDTPALTKCVVLINASILFNSDLIPIVFPIPVLLGDPFEIIIL